MSVNLSKATEIVLMGNKDNRNCQFYDLNHFHINLDDTIITIADVLVTLPLEDSEMIV